MIGARFPLDEIPFIPAKIDIADVINTGGRLIPHEDIAGIKAEIKFNQDNADGKYSKKTLGTKFSIEKIGDQYYAIYKGVKHGKHVGTGGFGTVKIVQNIDDGTWAVIKTILRDKDSTEQSHEKSINKETKQLKHHHHFIGRVKTRISKSKQAVQDAIIMQLAPGIPVDKIIKDKTRSMPPVKWLDMAIAITRAVSDLHDKGTLHRDLKPANMLFDPAAGVVTIVDFGLGQFLDEENPEYLGGRGGGTARYLAPEIREPAKKPVPYHAKSSAGYAEITTVAYNEATEIYALGVTLIELFGFTKKDGVIGLELETLKRITNPSHREELRSLLTSMIDPDPGKRPDMSHILEVLTRLREYEIDLFSKISMLACINVNDYIHASAFQKAETLKTAQAADEVMLCFAPSEETRLESMRLKHELEGAGVCVFKKALIFENNDKENITRFLKEFIQWLTTERDVIYRAHYISPLSFQEGQTYTHMKQRNLDHVTVTVDHKKIAADRIGKQLSRMKLINAEDIRLQYLSRFLYELEQGNIKTYDQLFGALNQLENEMSSKIAKKFGIYSDAAKKVHKTSQIIDRDAVGIKKPPGNKTL